MLKLLNRNRRSQKTIWVIISVIVVFGMVAFYSAPGKSLESRFGSVSSAINNTDILAKVGAEKITAQEYINSLDAMVQMYQNMMSNQGPGSPKFNYNALKGFGLDKTVTDSLIRKKIILMEARRLSLEATREELQSRIRESFSPDGKWIGFDKYKKLVERSGQTIDQYESNLHDQITEEKVRNFITSAVQVSDQEAQDQYKRENSSFNVLYTVIEPNKLIDKIAPTEAELREFFDAHKLEFRINAQQHQVDYIYISQETVGKTLQISDEDLQKDYDPEKFLDAVRVSQIMLKVLAAKDEDTVKAKAEELAARIRGAAATKAEDFDALARGNSQDTATKDKGGDLGFLSKDSIKPGSYLQRTFAMKVGEISDPIKDGGNYYILKLVDRRNKTFEQARETLLASARNRLSYKKASDIADEAAKRLSETKDIKTAAAEVAAKTGMTPDETLRQTPFFASGDDVPTIGSNPSFEETVLGLAKPGDIGSKVGVRGGFAIPQLVAFREPHDSEFDEVKSKVEIRCKSDKANKQAAEKARAILNDAGGTVDGLKAAIEKAGFKVETKDGYKVETKDGYKAETKDGYTKEASLDREFGQSDQVGIVADTLKEGEIVKDPIVNKGKHLVFGVSKRNEADMTKFNEESKDIKQTLLRERTGMMFDSYVNNIKKKLLQEGKILIKQELIDLIFASNPTGGGK